MKTRSLAYAVAVALAFGSSAALAAPLEADFVTLNRGAIIGELLQTWQERINTEGLAVEDAKNWSKRAAAKLGRLSDSRLALAQRATSLDDLEMLFVSAPIASGTALGALGTSLPGDITIMPAAPEAKAGGDASSTPAGSPLRYQDLVFTAVTPCRIYDTRFRTIALNGAAAGARWPAFTPQPIVVGPLADYTTYGGQAVACLGSTGGTSGNPPSRIAALMAAVSTVSQAGAGYLVFWASGGVNPNPYGVAQWFQPGIVTTSFVVMPTGLINPVFSAGQAGNFATHVIIDVVGYFSKTKSDLMAMVTGATGATTAGFHLVSSARLGVGTYEVIFDRDVTLCNYSGSMAQNSFGTAAGEITIVKRAGNANGVFVTTHDSAGTSADRNFSVKVSCEAE